MALESKEGPRNLWKEVDANEYQVKSKHRIIKFEFIEF